MRARRFVFDDTLGYVVEVGTHKSGAAFGDVYDDTAASHRQTAVARSMAREAQVSALESSGQRLVAAALERADRRVFAHKRYGDESRWRSA